jgi:hypothetical protein
MNEQPYLSKEAKRLLSECANRHRNLIYNIAENRALGQHRKEISETDILVAVRSIPTSVSSTKRKWGIRILVTVAFAVTGIQVGAFYSLFKYMLAEELPVLLLAWLISPTMLIMVLAIVFAWIFREDWI